MTTTAPTQGALAGPLLGADSLGNNPERSGATPLGEGPVSPSASVLVEVGNGMGALVLYVGDSFRSREIEISRVGSLTRVHTGVYERRTSAATMLAAVFGSIPAGEYVVWRDHTTAAGTVTVVDGQVTEHHLPESEVQIPPS